MAAHRDFDDYQQKAATEPGPTFNLKGQEFRCLPEAPGGILARMATAVQVDTRGRQVFNAPDICAFIEGVLADRVWHEEEYHDGETVPGRWEDVDDVARFRDLVFSKDTVVPIELLGRVFLWLSETYVARPTGPSGR